MPTSNVMDDFRHIEDWSHAQLLDRRTALIGTSPSGDYRQLADEALQELVAIHRVLRRKTSTGRPTVSRKGGQMIPTLDSL